MAELFETQTQAVAGYAIVAIEQGIDASPDGLTYAFGPGLGELAVGDRVIVPLGKRDRMTPGYVMALRESCDLAKVKFVARRDESDVSLTGDLIELARWISAYYCCPLGMVFATMLPAAVKQATGTVRQMQVRLADKGPADDVKLTKLQQAAADAAKKVQDDDGGWVDLKRLADLVGARTVGPIKQLIDKGVLQTRLERQVRADPYAVAEAKVDARRDIALNEDQQRAVDAIVASAGSFAVHLLHGVTGSGKTEVYLRVIEQLVGDMSPEADMPRAADATSDADPTGAIVLVPEIALTPQTVARFHGRFEHVAVLHSGLTASQRHDQWRRIREGRSRIVVGARSAIFAPLRRLAVIIVDEEHEQSYKQDQLPRYHARDVAIKRAQMLEVPVVLGSATPSLESYFNATQPIDTPGGNRPARAGRQYRYNLLRLPQRVAGLTLPKVQIVDMISERKQRRGVHLLSRRLEDLLRHTLSHNGQTMLLLNRRGYANYIACPDHRCGWMKTCDHCDTTMVYHKLEHVPSGGVLICHHCTGEQILPTFCPICGKKVTVFGMGVQRVEEEVAKKLPEARVTRMDSDTMRRGRDYHAALEAFGRGQTDILLGTQMIAKGLDFPNVRLVGVISADTALHLPDFRSAERTFQLIAQVAGRAGRSEKPGVVVVQTFSPDDPVIKLAARHDYESFAEREIELRTAVELPPAARMARVVVRHRDYKTCCKQAADLNAHVETFNKHLGQKVQVRGPLPCPIARIADYHRQQIEMLAPGAADLQELMTALRNAKLLHANAHTAVDVDPVSLM